MKDKWQEELQRVKLKESAKARIIQRAQGSAKITGYRFVFPLFIALAMVFLFLTATQQLPMNSHQASGGEALAKAEIVKDSLGWMIASFVLYIAFLLQAMYLPIYTKRYHRIPKIQRYIVTIKKTSQHVGYMLLLNAAVIVGAILLFGIPLLVIQSALLYKIYCLTFITLNSICLLCWSIRDAHHPTCPHCGEGLGKKTFKELKWSSLSTACTQCKQKIFTTKTSRNKAGYINFTSVLIIFIPWLNIPLWIALLHLAVFYLFIFKYYYYYVYVFTTEDEPLW